MASYATFLEGVPEDIPALFPMGCRPGIPVLGGLMRKFSEYKRILDRFTKVSHHSWKFSRSISLNAHYITAFNNPRDTLVLQTLADQAFAGHVHVPYVWESSQDATSQPYLVTDLHPRTPSTLRLRSNILPLSQSYPAVYVNKKTHKTVKPLPVNFS